MNAANFRIETTASGVQETPQNQLSVPAYDAIEPKGKRRQPPAVVVREDNHLRGRRRLQMMSNAADLKRNLAIAAWMIRRHLDYVARFNYQPRTGDRGFNRALAELMTWQSEREQMDRGNRLSREKFFRLLEARRVLDGDCGAIRLRSGQLQFIKGDLLGDPPKNRRGNTLSAEWESGVLADRGGAPLRYGIFGRADRGRGRKFARSIAAQRFIHYGFFDDCATDQVRGISPFMAAINDLRDVYESIDYAKTKVKISQLLGIKFTRKSDSEKLGDSTSSDTGSEEGEDSGEAIDERPSIDLSSGVMNFDMDEGEDVDLVESATPATQTMEFIKLVIHVGMKALDLPYSFFDEKHTNFHGSRGAWLQYERSALDKRDDQREARNRWTLWSYQNWVDQGLLTLPSSIGNIREIRHRWVPKGMPWWKPSEEVGAATAGIAAGLNNPFNVTDGADLPDPYENIDATIDCLLYAQEQGVERLGRALELSFDVTAQLGASQPNADSELSELEQRIAEIEAELNEE